MTALKELIDPTQPGDFNQAMMELGALVCTPKNPDCKSCPLNKDCQAFIQDKAEEFPVPATKKVSRVRHLNFLVLEEEKDGQHFTYINKRTGGDIWEGLYEFLLVESDKALNVKTLLNSDKVETMTGGTNLQIIATSPVMQHILTHQTLYAKFYTLKVKDKAQFTPAKDAIRVNWNDIHDYPVSRLTEKFLETRHDTP
jgi:A/G-specific adenine glycosylase